MPLPENRHTVRKYIAPSSIVFPNGDRWQTEVTEYGYDDWRDTPWGPTNFGWVRLSHRPMIVRAEQPARRQEESAGMITSFRKWLAAKIGG